MAKFQVPCLLSLFSFWPVSQAF